MPFGQCGSFRVKPKAPVQPAKAETQPASPVANGRPEPTRETDAGGFKTARIELPPRWRNDPRAAAPRFVLSTGRFLLSVRFPVGSPDGKYRFQILDQSKKVLAALQGTARTENGVTALTVPIDTSNWPAGNYTLNVSEPELDVWVEYGLEIKKHQP